MFLNYMGLEIGLSIIHVSHTVNVICRSKRCRDKYLVVIINFSCILYNNLKWRSGTCSLTCLHSSPKCLKQFCMASKKRDPDSVMSVTLVRVNKSAAAQFVLKNSCASTFFRLNLLESNELVLLLVEQSIFCMYFTDRKRCNEVVR